MSERINPQQIQKTLREYEYLAGAEFIVKVERYIDLLLRWNEKISLTRVVEPKDIVRFHFGESLLVLSAAEIRGGRLADVGSGAGFPGFPLAMAVPDLQVTLIEANAKKAAFLSEALRRLGQGNVKVYHGRAESLPEDRLFEYVSSRAVGNQKGLLKWSETRIGDSGRVLLWISRSNAQQIQTGNEWQWLDPVRIPGAKERVILIGATRRRSRE